MLRTIGVTGTNGKTTTATWTAAALGAVSPHVFLSTTLGAFLGEEAVGSAKTGWEGFVDAATIAEGRGAEWGVVELTSQALWAGAATAWPCEVGVFTNFSRDHLDAHGDAAHYLACKAQLFVALPRGGVAVLNGCDAAFPLLSAVVPRGCRTLTYGSIERGEVHGRLDAVIRLLETSWSGTRFVVTGAGIPEMELVVRGVGAVYAENATAALLAANVAGVPFERVASALARAPAPPGRFQVVYDAPRVVLDYAHSPDALARTMLTARRLTDEAGGRLVVVFGAGGDRDRGKRAPMGHAARTADRIVLTSDNPRSEDPRAIAEELRVALEGHRGVTIILDRAEAIASALASAGRNDVVVLSGKGHERTQTGRMGTIPFDDAEVVRAWFRSKKT